MPETTSKRHPNREPRRWAWKGEVKVQRSIRSSDNLERLLFLSKDGAIVYMADFPVDDPLRGWFGKRGARDEWKFFAFAVQHTNPGPIDIKRKVPWRDW